MQISQAPLGLQIPLGITSIDVSRFQLHRLLIPGLGQHKRAIPLATVERLTLVSLSRVSISRRHRAERRFLNDWDFNFSAIEPEHFQPLDVQTIPPKPEAVASRIIPENSQEQLPLAESPFAEPELLESPFSSRQPSPSTASSSVTSKTRSKQSKQPRSKSVRSKAKSAAHRFEETGVDHHHLIEAIPAQGRQQKQPRHSRDAGLVEGTVELNQLIVGEQRVERDNIASHEGEPDSEILEDSSELSLQPPHESDLLKIQLTERHTAKERIITDSVRSKSKQPKAKQKPKRKSKQKIAQSQRSPNIPSDRVNLGEVSYEIPGQHNLEVSNNSIKQVIPIEDTTHGDKKILKIAIAQSDKVTLSDHIKENSSDITSEQDKLKQLEPTHTSRNLKPLPSLETEYSPAVYTIESQHDLTNIPANPVPQELNDAVLLRGYSVGGPVIASDAPAKPIAASDTVPAMLTPGEFVINAIDAQKHLPLLQNINQGGTVEPIPTKVQNLEDTRPPENVLEAENQSARTLAATSPQFNMPHLPLAPVLPVGRHQEFLQLRSLHSSAFEENYSASSQPVASYESPIPIFQSKPLRTSVPPSSNAPVEWTSIEDLLQITSDQATSPTSKVEMVDRRGTFPPFSAPVESAKGREVMDSTAITDPQPITETIDRSSIGDDQKSVEVAIEALAQAVYSRLHRRLEIERERQGIYSGRLPW